VADVLLTHPYHLYYDRSKRGRWKPYPPLGTLYPLSSAPPGLPSAVLDLIVNVRKIGFEVALRQHRPENRGCLEGQFNFPFQDVPHTHALSRLHILETSRQAGAIGAVERLGFLRPHCGTICERVFRCVLLGEQNRPFGSGIPSFGREKNLRWNASGPRNTAPKLANEKILRSSTCMRDLNHYPSPRATSSYINQYRDGMDAAHGYSFPE